MAEPRPTVFEMTSGAQWAQWRLVALLVLVEEMHGEESRQQPGQDAADVVHMAAELLDLKAAGVVHLPDADGAVVCAGHDQRVCRRQAPRPPCSSDAERNHNIRPK